jgi:hypothetical protein
MMLNVKNGTVYTSLTASKGMFDMVSYAEHCPNMRCLINIKKIFCFMSACQDNSPKTRIKSTRGMSLIFIVSVKAKTTTAKSNIIVAVVSHETNQYDGDTLAEVLDHIQRTWGEPVEQAVCDRGYRGRKTVVSSEIILPAPALKRDKRYQRDKKRKRCRRRAAIEPRQVRDLHWHPRVLRRGAVA